jgi:hypothetical protein
VGSKLEDARELLFELLCPVDQLAQLTNWPKFYGQYVNSDSLINWAAIDQLVIYVLARDA